MKIYKISYRYRDVWEKLNDMYDMDFDNPYPEIDENVLETPKGIASDIDEDPRHFPNGTKSYTPEITSRISHLLGILQNKNLSEEERLQIKEEIRRLNGQKTRAVHRLKQQE